MVPTAVQTTAFFEENAQMGIPHDSVIQLWNEGISTVNNLADFDKIHSLSWWKTSENQEVESLTQLQCCSRCNDSYTSIYLQSQITKKDCGCLQSCLIIQHGRMRFDGGKHAMDACHQEL